MKLSEKLAKTRTPISRIAKQTGIPIERLQAIQENREEPSPFETQEIGKAFRHLTMNKVNIVLFFLLAALILIEGFFSIAYAIDSSNSAYLNMLCIDPVVIVVLLAVYFGLN